MTVAAPAQVFVDFTRRLRAEGLAAPPSLSKELLAAVQTHGLRDGTDNYYAMRAITIRRPEDIATFDAVFIEFFGGGKVPEIISEDQAIQLEQLGLRSTADGEESEEDADAQAGASSTERLLHRDFLAMDEREWIEAQRLIQEMRFRSAESLTHRWQPDRRGNRPDLRRMFKRMSRPDGEMMHLDFQSRRPRRRPILILADVSGSMERYAEAFLYFAHALRGRLGRVEAFVFSTRLTRITREMSRRDPLHALAMVSESVEDWSGGTRIGEAFADFNLRWSRRVTRGGPICLVLSDGWDCGEPEELAAATEKLSRSVHSLVWLNPLAASENYRPATRGMVAALPYIDHLVPAASISDLSSIIELIESIPQVAGPSIARPIASPTEGSPTDSKRTKG